MQIEKAFERIGARAKVVPYSERILEFHLSTKHRRVLRIPSTSGTRIDILQDSKGEFFQIREAKDKAPEVIDIQRDLRHLVLMIRNRDQKEKYLCGHDERHWFVAAVPGQDARDVRTAMEALRPEAAKAPGTIRQGEWMFVPNPDLDLSTGLVFHNEPIRRGRSKPHHCQELFRRGGIQVYVNRRYAPNGTSQHDYQSLINNSKDSSIRIGWTVMTKDAEVFARGRISHKDHYSLYLPDWCRVYMNLEDKAPHAEAVAFLD